VCFHGPSQGLPTLTHGSAQETWIRASGWALFGAVCLPGLIAALAMGKASAKAVEGSETAPAAQEGACLDPSAISDRSGAIRRNEAALAAPELCVTMDEFREGSLLWRLLIVRHRAAPDRVFWFVPHDNEADAFDSAVYGVRRYGGTVVAVKTGGRRMNGRQDPNRNFDTGTGPRCRQQVARSPQYTRQVLRPWNGTAPIIALHTNERGYSGDGKGGKGTISIARMAPHVVPFRADAPIGASPDDTIAYLASVRAPAEDGQLMALASALNRQGINVAYEVVAESRNDCSLSNYAALTGIAHYVNLEVVETDGKTQRRMLDIVLVALRVGPLVP
jgi:hypothetical protein